MKIISKTASIITRDLAALTKDTENLYESISVVSKRANQIAVQTKEELNSKLADFSTNVDPLEEVHENKEQIEISRYYERLPKASTLATDEFLEGHVSFRYKEIENE